jgi:hypothetical protein
MFDVDIEVMMRRGEVPPPPLPPPFRPPVTQAGPVVMAANPHIKVKR